MAEPIRVLLFPHPFEDDSQEFTVEAGATIAEILGPAAVDLPAVVAADGKAVPPEQWATVKPEAALAVRRVPQGDVGRILGTIAVMALATWTGQWYLNAAYAAGPLTAAGGKAVACVDGEC